jgi:predicted nucleotidyltransferase
LARDRRGRAIDFSPLVRLLERIVDGWQPEQVWLFGSRARGNATLESDWDLLVVLPDDAGDDALDPLAAWRLRRDAGVPADVVPCLARDFHEDRNTPNTLAYEAATEGILLYER